MSSRRQSAELKMQELKRHTRKSYSIEEKIRIVLEGLKGESSMEDLCLNEGISPALYNNWSKEFIEGGKSRLNGEIKKEGPSSEMQSLKIENTDLKQLVAELTLELRMLRKSLNGVE
ncbi:MAG TPA: transposase [Draconibacterium sp.]|jgi:transposase|nr:transposase [Draconibacterium sp.]